MFQIKTATVFNLNNNSSKVKTLVSYKRAWCTSRIASQTKDYFYHKFRCTSFLTYREQLWNWHLEQHVFNQRKYLLIASNNHNLGRFESLVNLKKRQNKTTKSRPKNNTLNWWQTGRNSCPLLEESILKSKTSFFALFLLKSSPTRKQRNNLFDDKSAVFNNYTA